MMKSGFLRRIIKTLADWATPLAPHYRHWELKNKMLRLAGIRIANQGVAIGSGFQCIDGHEENLTIERYVAIGHNVRLWNFNTIHIGQFCMLAAGVTLTNGWHDKNSFIPASGPLTIGPGCWIGANATIVGSLTIGANAIIAAGALVNEDVPANAIVAGVPAKIIGTRDLPDRIWHLDNIFFSPHTFEIVE